MFTYFERLVSPFPDREVDQPPNTLFAFCRYYLRGSERQLGVLAILSTALAILEAFLFHFMGTLVDWVSSTSPAELFAQNSGYLIGVALLMLLVIPALELLSSLVLNQGLIGNCPMSIRWSMHRYLLTQSMAFYQNDFSGRIATKVLQTSIAIRESVVKLVDIFVYVIASFLGLMFIVAQADIRLLIPMLIWLTIYITIQYFLFPQIRQASSKLADARSLMTGTLVDSYTNISTIKLFSHTEREEAYAKERLAYFLAALRQLMRIITKLSILARINNYFLLFSITALSLYLWSESSITAGVIAIAISLSLRLNSLSHWIMWELSTFFENVGTVIDGMGTLSQSRSVLDIPDAKELTLQKSSIHFENISFNYHQGAPVINKLNLQIQPGEKVGLVGRSGAGKSTLTNLLLRFYDVNEGKITLDGTDIKTVSQESLRRHLGMVSQDTSLLHRSIRENILYGRPEASEEELLAAAQKAQALEFIENLVDPKGGSGFDAQVGERGVKLSGGQRQRIAIARVLLKNAPILLLDEATSALDSEVEAAIQQSLSKLMENKTVIAIAHRLSTIAAMDRLVVLDKGCIVEQGSHQELLQQGGIYAQLWAHQRGDFIGKM